MVLSFMACANSNCSLNPHMAHARPRVQVLKAENPCCELGHRKLPSLVLKIDFVGHATGNIVGVAAFAVVDRVGSSCACVLMETFQQ